MRATSLLKDLNTTAQHQIMISVIKMKHEYVLCIFYFQAQKKAHSLNWPLTGDFCTQPL